jgi:hypothetical protein
MAVVRKNEWIDRSRGGREGYATIVRHHQFQNLLLQVRPVITGVAMGDGDGLLIALRDILAAQRKAGRVEMIEAVCLRNSAGHTKARNESANEFSSRWGPNTCSLSINRCDRLKADF